MKALDELRARLLEVDDLNSVAALARWDQMTQMPDGGAATRGRHLATLSRMAHEKLTDPAVGRLLERLERQTASLPPDTDEASLVRVTRRRYERTIRVPASLMAELDREATDTYHLWRVARPAGDFAAVVPQLQKLLDLSRRLADCFPGYESVADPLIDLDDEGIRASTVRDLFRALREQLVPLLRAIASRPCPDTSFLQRSAPAHQQLAIAREAIEAFGYDFDRGRLDLTPHPFSTRIALDDVRITTRVSEGHLGECFFIALHEAGHGLYEQGGRAELAGSPLAGPPSAGADESQARLWENVVGRSEPFWQYFYPRMKQAFPGLLDDIDPGRFYRAINHVRPSLLRGQADEITYNLHIMLRFDLELDLLEGRVAAPDLARTWRERFEADFGIPVPDDGQGVLQDVHWYSGRIGGVFQGYVLGNIMSAQLFAAAVSARSGISAEIARGEFGGLREWLRQNVYVHGAKFTATELMRRATGRDLSIQPYVDYLWTKYQRLYDLPPRHNS